MENLANERTIGMELRLKRTELKLSMKEVADTIGISENYMSNIERDNKVPSDPVIRELAKYYSFEETYLFERFNRVPLVISEEIKNNKVLNETLYHISVNEDLSEDRKQKLYEDIQKLYLEVLKVESGAKDG